ncbi:MAG: multicopper oxidase family protein [Planctomycetes bacterium]|nr:multicopper oxidase family protein [Planctomycetota bacterium]
MRIASWILALGLLTAACTKQGGLLLDDMPNPQVRQSSGGVLSTSLTMSNKSHDIDSGLFLQSASYDGGIPGPTFIVNPGDTLEVTLTNSIEMPPGVDGGMDPRLSNMHFHGLHVSPLGNSDNPLISIPAGGTYNYTCQIPANHPGGFHWYHPHHHGTVDWQVANGMQGAIIIRGALDLVPEVAAARDRILMIANIKLDPVTGGVPVMTETAADLFLVNGKVRPTIHMRPGEVQRWRVAAAGGSRYMPLALDGHNLHQIAFDGMALAAPQTVSEMMLIPGQRAEVLVKAGAVGTYLLRKKPYQNSGMEPLVPEIVLADVVVSGAALDMPLPTTLVPVRPDPGAPLVTRLWTFDVLSAFPPQFGINLLPFDPTRIDASPLLGSVEEWTIQDGSGMHHPFHLHTNHFLVTHINGLPLATPVWRDTVNVPQAGTVTVKIPFDDFPGPTVLHCHLLTHEDLGMMTIINTVVTPPK